MEVQALDILGKIKSHRIYERGEYQPKEEERTILKKFFAHISGNSAFNRRVSDLIETQKEFKPKGRAFEEQDLLRLREFSYKSSQFGELYRLTPKLQKIATFIQEAKTHELTGQEKLTLPELRQIVSFANLFPALDWITNLGGWETTSGLGKQKANIETLTQCYQTIEAKHTAEHPFNTGDIVIEAMEAYTAAHAGISFRRMGLFGWMQKIRNVFLKHRHIHPAIGLTQPEGYRTAKLAPEYEEAKTSFELAVHSRVYRFDFQKMVTPHAWEIFRLSLAEDLKQPLSDDEIAKQLNQRYQKIISAFFSDPKKFENLSVGIFNQITAVLKRHYQKKKLEPKDIDFKSEQEMICSEFVGKVLAYCLDKMEKELQQEMRTFTTSHPDALEEEIEKAFVMDQSVLQKPIRDTERFSAMHPDRLASLLSKCTTQVPRPKFLNDIIQAPFKNSNPPQNQK